MELIEAMVLEAPPPLSDLMGLFRGTEAEDLARRILLSSAADLLDEFFESVEVKAMLATATTIGLPAGPRTPGTALMLGHMLLHEINGMKQTFGYAKGGLGGNFAGPRQGRLPSRRHDPNVHRGPANHHSEGTCDRRRTRGRQPARSPCGPRERGCEDDLRATRGSRCLGPDVPREGPRNQGDRGRDEGELRPIGAARFHLPARQDGPTAPPGLHRHLSLRGLLGARVGRCKMG